MKKVAIILGILLLALFLLPRVSNSLRQRIKADLQKPVTQVIPTDMPVAKSNGQKAEALFVPYWSLSNKAIIGDFDRFIYFGITQDDSGLATSEDGFKKLPLFLRTVPQDAKRDIVLRMLDSSFNLATLKDNKKQEGLIQETITLTKEESFNGIVLDLELAALPFDSLIKQINSFTSSFYQQAKKEKIHFALAIYGDTFYRVRPFQVKLLQKNTDEIMVMAYDFHKTSGNPGPNFPLEDNGEYGYSFSAMLKDFLRFVPAEKLTIIFGMFGHDWTVDTDGKSVGLAQSLSLYEINQLLAQCESLHCIRQRDNLSGEAYVNYVDREGKKHILWYEDDESVKKKKAVAEKNGIHSFAYWAYSYF